MHWYEILTKNLVIDCLQLSRIMLLCAIFLSVLVTSVWGSLGKDTLAKCLYEEVVASSQVTVTSSRSCLYIYLSRTRFGARPTAMRQAMEL